MVHVAFHRCTARALAALVLAASGCAAAREAHEVGSGIYELTVRSELDACSPARRTGEMGLVGVVANGSVLNVAVPDGASDALARVSLPRASGWHLEVETALEGCPDASLLRSWSVVETDADAFGLVFVQQWRGVAGCAAARETMPAAPTSDCRAEHHLQYRLAEACAAPCEVRVVAGAPVCSCD